MFSIRMPETRRWSLNNDVSLSYESGAQYVPTLSDIPPSPMLATDSRSIRYRENASCYDERISDSLSVSHSQQNIQLDQSSVPDHSQHHAVVSQIQSNDNVQVTTNENLETRPSANQGYFQQSFSEPPGAGYNSGRPNTLSVDNYLSHQATGDSTAQQTGKSLVTLSPDTVDFVLNQHMQDDSSPTPFNNIVPIHQESAKDPEKDLTLSPGKTSLIVKSLRASQQKDSTYGFSNGNFLIDYDKHDETDDMNNKFLDEQNGSVMLSESAAVNKNEFLYVNSKLDHNPLSKQTQDFQNVSQLPVSSITDGICSVHCLLLASFISISLKFKLSNPTAQPWKFVQGHLEQCFPISG